jgi:hypothetical protein
MNEQVKILWANAAESNFGDSWEEQTAFMSKFAELIVRECAGVGYDASYYECALNVSNKIKQQFGVEEK